MPTISTDCHLTLTHPDVNGGDPYGFLLSPDDGSPVIIQREITTSRELSVRVFFDAYLADSLLNPDGSVHTAAAAEMYARLVEYLAQTENLTLSFSGGTISNIGATGHSATEHHYPTHSVVACQFNNAGVYYGVLSSATYDNSIWDGTLTWASSCWR